jgi:uncharacterized protein
MFEDTFRLPMRIVSSPALATASLCSSFRSTKRVLSGLSLGSFANSDDVMRKILTTSCTIAFVGASNKPDRPSYEVLEVPLHAGYTVLSVNPGLVSKKIHDQTVYAALYGIPVSVDMVTIFRRTEDAGKIVHAIAIAALSVWLPIGAIDYQAADRAQAAGLDVVMNACPALEMRRLLISGPI